ncbi:hypothetical protein [Homoserinimonas hongtaonis]|nr:hypothetical protein [Salinibacterium hongtaonis]
MASPLATKYLQLESVFAGRMDVRAIGGGVRHMRKNLSQSRLAEFAAAV